MVIQNNPEFLLYKLIIPDRDIVQKNDRKSGGNFYHTDFPERILLVRMP